MNLSDEEWVKFLNKAAAAGTAPFILKMAVELLRKVGKP